MSVGRTKLINETVAGEWTRRDCVHYSYQCVLVYCACLLPVLTVHKSARSAKKTKQTELLMGEDGKDDKVQAGE